MANSYVKKGSATLFIREMIIQTTITDRLIPVGRAIIKNQVITRFGKGVEKREPLHTVAGNINWHGHYGKEVWRFLRKSQL